MVDFHGIIPLRFISYLLMVQNLWNAPSFFSMNGTRYGIALVLPHIKDWYLSQWPFFAGEGGGGDASGSSVEHRPCHGLRVGKGQQGDTS